MVLCLPAAAHAAPAAPAARDPIADYWTPARLAAARPLEGVVSRTGRLSIRRAAASARFPFTSSPVLTPQTAPYSATGKLFATDSGGDFNCSGTAIRSANQSVVFTAAHCLYKRRYGVSRNIVFIPAYDALSQPFGKWTYDRLFVFSQWSLHRDDAFDYGALVMAPRAGRLLGSAVGGLPLATGYSPYEQRYLAVGYPGTFLGGRKMWQCASGYAGIDGSYVGAGPRPIAIGCDMREGSSGGGWMLGNGGIGSVTAYSLTDRPGLLYGPRFGTRATRLLAQAEAVIPGVCGLIDVPYRKTTVRFDLRIVHGTIPCEVARRVAEKGIPGPSVRPDPPGWRCRAVPKSHGRQVTCSSSKHVTLIATRVRRL